MGPAPFLLLLWSALTCADLQLWLGEDLAIVTFQGESGSLIGNISLWSEETSAVFLNLN